MEAVSILRPLTGPTYSIVLAEIVVKGLEPMKGSRAFWAVLLLGVFALIFPVAYGFLIQSCKADSGKCSSLEKQFIAWLEPLEGVPILILISRIMWMLVSHVSDKLYYK